ncbi:MAG: hypothetical protein LBH20_08730 [Treponema sp.]|nr:hypothetical protein [Treponema sp.]
MLLAIYLLFPGFRMQAESFRTVVAGSVEVSPYEPSGSVLSMGINDSVLINLGAETRFFRGIEVEISAPQAWLSYRGSLVMAVYKDLNRQTAAGVADFDGNRIVFESLPGKLQTVYHVPLRSSHGLRNSPYATVLANVNPAADFPLLLRFMPVIKGISNELEKMTFNMAVRPILSDEGAVRLIHRYPPQLRNRPFSLLIDTVPVDNLSEQRLLKEGEHHLVVLSEDYRNESRRFVVERAKILDLIIELQDPTPLIIFEGPRNAQIFLDNVPIPRDREAVAVEPGIHEAKFLLDDYTVIKTLNVLRGKTYRVALAVDLTIQETA